jgi:hypothetical protein
MRQEGVIDWIKSIIFLIILIPILIIGGIFVLFLAILTGPNWKRCTHWKECPWYEWNSYTCNEDFGMAYGYGRPGGCYIRMDERKKELNKEDKKLRRLR